MNLRFRESSDWCAFPSGEICRPRLSCSSSSSAKSLCAISETLRGLETFEQDVAAVPVVHVHHVSLADLVDVHVVAEHLGQRLQRLLVDAEQRDEVEGVVDQHRLTRVADVHDVDVGGLLVVTSTA